MDLVRSGGLRVYQAPDLRVHVLNAALLETARGIRLAKEKGSRKVDAAVALAMAVYAALLAPRGMPNVRWLGETEDLEPGWTGV